MSDPLASIAAEAETGGSIGSEGELQEAPQGPSIGDRVIELIKPCPEDPLTKKGFISQGVNGWLSRRSGVPSERIQVGENLAHCIDHLFPGGGSGLPPILGLAKSLLEFRAESQKHPDNGKLVRP